jgi:hypothetical protein
MMDDNTYRFSFESGYDNRDDGYGYPKQRTVEVSVSHDETAEWTSVMLDFADFLSSIYGYDVKNKLRFVDYGGGSVRAQEYSIDPSQSEFKFDDEEWS